MNIAQRLSGRLNWPFIGIMFAATVTLVAVILVIASPPRYTGPELATVDSVDVSDSAAKKIAGELAERDGCFFVLVDGRESFAIWPEGFSRRDNAVVSADGRSLVAGDAFSATGETFARAEVVESEYLKRLTGSCIKDGSSDQVIVLFAVT